MGDLEGAGMRRVIRWAGLVLAAAAVLAGCGGEEAVKHSFASDSEYVTDKGVLVVGVTDFEPLDYIQDGKWMGFDAEMAGLFAESIGVSAEFMEIDWKKKTELLNNGTIDCVWNGMTLSEKVREEMECSAAYLNNAQMVVVPVKNAEKLRTAKDCMHLLFAAEVSSAGEQELKDRNYRFTSASSQMEALENVISGKADAAVIDAIMAGALIGEGKQFEELICIDSLSSEEYGVGFRKGSDLAEKVNAFWRESFLSGVLQERAEKYGLETAVIEP